MPVLYSQIWCHPLELPVGVAVGVAAVVVGAVVGVVVVAVAVAVARDVVVAVVVAAVVVVSVSAVVCDCSGLPPAFKAHTKHTNCEDLLKHIGTYASTDFLNWG
eukprot:2442854-Alexandrium_andersonii.AAC.1